MKMLIGVLALLSSVAVADIEVTQSNFVVVDENEMLVVDITPSTTMIDAIAKISRAQEGTYTVLGSVTVSVNRAVIDPPVEPPLPPPIDPVYYSAMVSWTAPTTYYNSSEPFDMIGGYRIRYGSTASLGMMLDVHNVTSFPVNGLSAGTWYFTVEMYTNEVPSRTGPPSDVVMFTLSN